MMSAEIRYWSPHSSARTEVDFLLRRGGELIAIEVKSGARYDTGLLRGLRAVAELDGMTRRILLYGGRRSFRTEDGIDVWTFDRMHEALAEGAFWPSIR